MELSKEDRIIARGIALNAMLLIEEFQELAEFELGYDEKSVEWVDNHISQLKEQKHCNREFEEEMTVKIGSYLGECIRENYGGEWIKTNDGWAVEVNNELTAFPFVKTKKRFDNGYEDSIHSFFDAVRHLPISQ